MQPANAVVFVDPAQPAALMHELVCCACAADGEVALAVAGEAGTFKGRQSKVVPNGPTLDLDTNTVAAVAESGIPRWHVIAVARRCA